MSQKTNLNVSPYYDDFDSSQNFHRVLFKPGFPVQSRELTTLQSILQNQIESFGNHIFKDGSVVVPGNVSYNSNYYAIKINPTHVGISVGVYLKNLIGLKIKGQTSQLSAVIQNVITNLESETSDYTIYVKYTSANSNFQTGQFVDGETLLLEENLTYGNTTINSGGTFASVIDLNASSVASSVSISQGIYYIRGHFVKVDDQTIILDHYTNTPSYRVGLVVTESLVAAQEDGSLYDNARGFSNFAAPGADRLKITATLDKKSLSDLEDKNFIEVLRLTNGIVKKIKDTDNYSLIREYLAKRTYEESGDYVVDPFNIEINDSLNDHTNSDGIFYSNQKTDQGNTPTEDLLAVKVSPGKAYVKGFDVEKPLSTVLDVEKPRDTKEIESSSVPFQMGNILRINNIFGTPRVGIDNNFTISLGSLRRNNENHHTQINKIGEARVYSLSATDGSSNIHPSCTPSNNGLRKEWELALWDIQTYTDLYIGTSISSSLLPVGSYVEGLGSGASGYIAVANGNDILTISQTSGSFQIGEQLRFNGIDENSRTVTQIRSYNTQDIKSVYQGVTADNTNGSTGLTTAFIADSVLTRITPQGFSPTDTIQINHTGVGTVTGRNWVGIKSDTIISYNVEGNTHPTYNRVGVVNSGGVSVGLGTVSAVVGLVNGTVPSAGNTFAGTFDIAVPHIQNEDRKQLYSPLSSKNVSTVNLAGSSLSVNRQIPGKSTSDIGTLQCTLDDAGIPEGNFEPFLPGRYSVHYANGTVESLSSDQVTLNNIASNVTFTGLTTSQSSNVRVNVTVRKNGIANKNKLYIRSSKVNIDKTLSGINTSVIENGTTVLTGLTLNNFYGLRIEDKEISLNKPDVSKVIAIYEAVGNNGVALDSLTFQGGLSLDSASVLGEKIIGQTSGAIGQIVTRKSAQEIEFVYLNSNTFVADETVKFEESNISGICNLVTKGNYIDKTQEYNLDKGQREQYYDYSRLLRKSGVSLATRPVLVIFDYYEVPSADKGDIYTVDSYEKERYKDGIALLEGGDRVSDVVDFRPRVGDFNSITASPFAFSSRSFAAAGSNPTLVVASNETSSLGYSYYLPRIDKVVLNKNATLSLVKGVSADNPKPPSSIEEAMEIAQIELPAYLYDPNNITVSLRDHKRYTMKDIGKLEDRIETVEKLTALSLLELDTKSLQIRDINGIDRYKSGFFVDGFKDRSSIDVENSDTKITLNTQLQELKSDVSLYSLKSQIAPSLTVNNNSADFSTDIELLDPSIKKTGDIVTLNYAEVGWNNLEQAFATKKQGINPFGIVNYNGSIKLTPSSDTWVRTITSETGVTIQSQSEWSDSYVSNLLSSSSIHNKLRARNVEFRASGLQPSTNYYSFFGGSGSIDIVPKILSISMISGVFQAGEIVSGYMNGKKIASIRLANLNHKTGIYDTPTITYSENPYSSSLSLNSYSASSIAVNIDTYSLADDAEGRFYGYLPAGAKIIGETSTAQATVSAQTLTTDSVGDLIGCFYIRNPLANPAPPVSVNNGSKSFKLTSSSTNSNGGSVTFSESTFHGSGIVNSSVLTESVIVRKPPASLPLNFLRQDPLSQTFRVDNVSGFLTGVDLFFAEKDTTEPVFVEIRETDIGGKPKNKLIQDFARVTIPAAGITTSSNGSIATNVKFPSPIYLEANKQYSLSLLSPASDSHKVWTAESNQATVATQTYPDAEQVIYTNQFTSGNLYKPQNGSIWESSINEDLKFKLYRSNFSSTSGIAYFHNPNVSTGSTYIARDASLPKLTNNAIRTFPRKVVVGIETSPERTTLEDLLPEGSQISNSTGGLTNGYLEYFGGNIGVVTTSNIGIGYSNGTYENVPLYPITGIGEGATAKVMIANGAMDSVSIASTGNKYKAGDVLGFSTSVMTRGTGATAVVTEVPTIDTLFLTNVTGQQFTNAQTLFFRDGSNNFTTTNHQCRGVSIIPDALYEGNVFEVNHYNHGMHADGNIVTISGIQPNTPTEPLTADIVSSNTTISIANTSNFTHFENRLVSATNPGYIIVNEEIIRYTGIGAGSLTGLTRNANESIIRNHSVNDTIQLYQLNRVSLCRINKHHALNSHTSTFSSIDSYRLAFSRSSAQPNANTKLATDEMLNFADERSLGGVDVRATQNFQFDEIIPQFNIITPENTNVSSTLRTVSGTSVGGQESSFNDQGFEPISLNEVNELSTPRIVASRVNEVNNLTTLPRSKSLTLGVRMETSNSNLSPVIDLSEAATFVLGRNRLNKPVSDYTKDSRTNQVVGDPHSSVYISKKINLVQPATSLKVLLNAYRDGSSDIRVLYKLFKTDSSEVNESYTLFPGYNNLKDTDGDGIGDTIVDLVINGNSPNKFLGDGQPDANVRASVSDEFLPYQYTVNGLEEFNAFVIKVVMSGTNEAFSPRIRDLRAIALA